jgi:hypothetical protein
MALQPPAVSEIAFADAVGAGAYHAGEWSFQMMSFYRNGMQYRSS